MFSRFSTKEGLMASGSMFLIVSTLFIILLGVGAVVSMGLLTQDPDNRNNVITVSGTGEAFAVPDIATFSFTARAEEDTVKSAQEQVSEKVATVLGVLGDLGIDDKDIKTTSYTSYPRYEWKKERVICSEWGCPPQPEGERVLVGYEQAQTIQIKVRDLEKVSDVLQSLGDANVDSMYGPNFEIDDEDAVLTEARKEAIAKARTKAEELASQLGVRLGKVVSFSDNNSGGYYPMARSMAVDSAMGYAEEAAFTPSVPTGENRVTASVSISFKIK